MENPIIANKSHYTSSEPYFRNQLAPQNDRTHATNQNVCSYDIPYVQDSPKFSFVSLIIWWVRPWSNYSHLFASNVSYGEPVILDASKIHTITQHQLNTYKGFWKTPTAPLHQGPLCHLSPPLVTGVCFVHRTKIFRDENKVAWRIEVATPPYVEDNTIATNQDWTILAGRMLVMFEMICLSTLPETNR